MADEDLAQDLTALYTHTNLCERMLRKIRPFRKADVAVKDELHSASQPFQLRYSASTL